MLKAYKDFWKRYVDFTGYSSRSDLWWVALWQFLLFLPMFFTAIITVASALVSAGYSLQEMDFSYLIQASGGFIFFIVLVLLWFVYCLATLIPTYSLMVRRLRDAGLHWSLVFLSLPQLLVFYTDIENAEGIGSLISFLAFVLNIVLIVLFCQPTKLSMKKDPYFGYDPSQGLPGFGQQEQSGFQNQQGFGQQPLQNPGFGQQQNNQTAFQGQTFGQEQPGFQGQNFSQEPVQNQSFVQQPAFNQQPVQNQPFGQQPAQPFGQPQEAAPQQPAGYQEQPAQSFSQAPEQPVNPSVQNPFASPAQPAEEPASPFGAPVQEEAAAEADFTNPFLTSAPEQPENPADSHTETQE